MNRLRQQSTAIFSSLLKRSVTTETENVAQGFFDFETQNTNHIYRKKLTKSEFVKNIVNNVVYNKDGIIVINKPYGVGIGHGFSHTEINMSQTFNDFYLKDIITDLSKELKVETLKLVTGPGRLASGATIFSTSEELQQKILKGIKFGRNVPMFMFTYFVVVVGQPEENILSVKIGIKKNEKEHKAITILDKQRKSQDVLSFRWSHKVISSSKLASLLKISVTKLVKKELFQFLAIKCLTPVLGDAIYSGRVNEVFGIPFYLDFLPEKAKNLNSDLLLALELNQDEAPIIPCHVHLHSIRFPFENYLNFYVSVPPSEQFVWTCQKLGLIHNDFISNKDNFNTL